MLPPSVVQLVLERRAPPRTVDSGAVLREVLSRSTPWMLLSFGTIIGALGIGLAVWRLGATSTTDARLGYAFIGLGLLTAGMPLILWRRILYAARHCVACLATVTELEYASSNRDTLDAVSHGMARGTWTVRDGAREFHESFENDSAWARELRVGSLVLVLAHPEKPRSLFAVAIQDAA
jgi:hypothetical protein